MVAGVSRERRIVALEQRKRAHRLVKIPLIAAEIGEAADDAVARYVAEQGPLPEVDDDQVNVIVFIPVVPGARDAA